jgi:phosphopantetheinyl transferase
MQVLERPIIVHHAVIALEAGEAALARWLAALPRQRRAELEARGEGARAASVLGMALLASCAREAGLALALSELQFPEGGKPHWRGGHGFSISHAGNRVACALATPGVAVGLDVEARAAVTLESLRLVTSDDERALVTSGRLEPASLWARKEAVLKAAARGVRNVVDARVGVDEGVLEGRTYALLDVPIAPDFAGAVALSGRPVALVLSERDGAALLASGP